MKKIIREQGVLKYVSLTQEELDEIDSFILNNGGLNAVHDQINNDLFWFKGQLLIDDQLKKEGGLLINPIAFDSLPLNLRVHYALNQLHLPKEIKEYESKHEYGTNEEYQVYEIGVVHGYYIIDVRDMKKEDIEKHNIYLHESKHVFDVNWD